MIEHKLLTEELHQIIIRPNPPMPWGQLKKIYFIFTFFILFIAIILSTINLYLAIPFYATEVAFLGYALYISSLKGTYYEEILITPHSIDVTFVNRKKKLTYSYDREWIKFSVKPMTLSQPTKIFLGEGIKKIYLGQKVNERDRKKLARLLRRSN